MELEIGMYVRTKDSIVKIEKILDGVMWDTQGHLHFGDFIKASHNIIDLIEVGDYVDRLRVVDRDENYIVLETFDERIFVYKNEPIKSIVTKEQFSQMEYKVGD